MITIITLIVLLISVLFVKSTIIIEHGKCRKTKVLVLIPILATILAFIPFVNIATMAIAPIVTLTWYNTGGFNDCNGRIVKVSEDTLMGKIFLFKI